MNCLGREREAINGNYMNIFWSTTSFKDKTVQMCYEKFRIDNSLLLFKLNVVALLGATLNFSFGLLSAIRLYNDLWVVKTLMLLRVVLLFSFLYICYRIYRIQRNNEFEQKDYWWNVKVTTHITDWSLVGMSLVNGAMYVWKSSLPVFVPLQRRLQYGLQCVFVLSRSIDWNLLSCRSV